MTLFQSSGHKEYAESLWGCENGGLQKFNNAILWCFTKLLFILYFALQFAMGTSTHAYDLVCMLSSLFQ